MSRNLRPLNLTGPTRQRGAIGLVGALVLGLAVLFTALSVDSGRLMLEQRRVQKIADMAAIDGSRAVCGAVADDVGDVIAAAQASAARNGYGGDLASEDNAVQVGTTDPDGGLRRFESTTVLESATAVQVTARNTVPSSLVAGGWLGGTTTLTARATAGDEPVAGFSAGSFLARVNPLLNPLLNGLLGAGLDLDLVSYQGLADANVTLLDLINAHGSVGNVEELLTAQTTIGEIITLTANALSNNPDDADAALTLNNIADQVTNTTPITLGDLLDIDTTDPGAVLNAQLSALDLLTLGAQVANETHAVSIPTAGVNIPGVVSSDLKLYVIEKPKIAIGPAGRNAEFDGPFPSDPQQVGTDLGPALAGALGGLAGNLHLSLQVPVVGPLVNALLQPLLSALRTLVSNVVGPIIASLGNLLLAPVLSALWVTLGGADVQVLTLDGNQPALRI